MPTLKIKKAQRSRKKLRCMITGQPGAGKTYSSLLLAKGLLYNKPDPKILVFDTECKRASLKVGAPGLEGLEFDVIDADPSELGRKVTYLDYIEAIKLAESEGYDLLIIDSATQEWEDIIERQNTMSGNSFQNWGKVKLLHQKFVEAFLYSGVHIILTIRSKIGYEVEDGTKKVKKVGLEAQQESNMPYFADFLFNIQSQDSHEAVAEKDETHIYDQLPSFVINERVGRDITDWLNEGVDPEVERKKVFVNKIVSYQTLLIAKDRKSVV